MSPIILDGYSLMNFISPPQIQFSHEGYILVPNKNSYAISAGVNKVTTPNVINIGTPIISGKTAHVPLLLDGKILNRHMAVFGMTGEGKSRFIYGLIKEFHRKMTNFLIIDPKGEYLHPIKSFCNDFVYLKPGSSSFPWGINSFQLPQNKGGENIVPIEDHIQFVVSILDRIFEETEGVSPQMRRLLHLVVIKTVEECGDFRTFVSWINRHKDLNIQGSHLENTEAGIINRIEKLFFGNTGRCFTVKQTKFELPRLLD
ncbi:MAG: helicase HerA domain-containing protein [Candidatus Hodarchaeota archaeon]